MQYNSITRTPDDFTANDGDLSLAINIINEDGAFRPLQQPKFYKAIPDEYTLKYIHRGTGYINYIYIGYNSIYYTPEEEEESLQILISNNYEGTIKNITSLGNTLIVTTDKGTFYATFIDNKYNWLGQKPPFTPISFGLNGDFKVSEGFDIMKGNVGANTIPPGSTNIIFSLENVTAGSKAYVDSLISMLTDTTLAQVNKFIQEEATEKGKFIFPFFVRYAYRLFDGSLFMHSYPILLLPTNDCNPTVFLHTYKSDNRGESSGDIPQTYMDLRGSVSALLCNLEYSIKSVNPQLNKWKDIIKSIDIYISAPIFTYDQAGKVYGWTAYGFNLEQKNNYDNFAIAKINNPHSNWKGASFYKSYMEQSYNFQYACCYDTKQSETQKGPAICMTLPKFEEKEILTKIGECSLFYKLASIDIENITPCSPKNVEFRTKLLTALTSQQVMTDDYNSHNALSAETLFSYNSRLNLANITETIFNGIPSVSQFTTQEVLSYDHLQYDITVNLKKEGRKITVRNGDMKADSSNIIDSSRPYYLFFPDADAYEAYIQIYYFENNIRKDIKSLYLPLKEHPLLNGSYFFNGFKIDINEASLIPPVTDATVKYPSKIYTSDLNNAFVFNPKNINTIGVSTILALSSTTKALSEGQFGQFPLYAFTSEGIWAMEVNATGGYSTKQAISRDVITGQPLQLDSAIAFMTNKGLMIIAGSESKCVSEQLKGDFSIEKYPQFNDLVTQLGFTQFISNFSFPKKPIMAYDYTRSRILLYSDDCSWVYSLKSGMWSMTVDKFNNAINSYPDVILMKAGNGAFKLSESYYDTPNKGLILSRPLKFSSHYLKTVYALLTHGVNVNIKSALYATIDFQKFILLKSSVNNEIRNICGTPYRAFSILLFLDLNKDSAINSTDFISQTKLTNKLR